MISLEILLRLRYDQDPVYRALFERISQLFAEQLRLDLAAMRSLKRVSICAKWCPSLYRSFDRRTLLCEGIARRLFPAELPEFQGCTERQYAYRARDKLRRSLSELTEYMRLPERLMCEHRWAEIRYKDLPAACLTKHAKSFEKHDAVRFRHFMDQVQEGRVKVNTGALQPHEIMRRAKGDGRELAQGQWMAMLQRLQTLGQLEDSVAVCDVSGSMSCEAAPGVTCMDVAISMSLLVAELSSKRQIITFHERPCLVDLPDTRDLAELASFVGGLPWGGSTNFHRVFELLKAKPPKKVIVFSDMQFAHAGGNGPVLRQVQASYREAGLQMPELVFWNLRGTSGAPALATDQGVLLMSGFSSRMLKMVTEYGPDPLTALCTALDNPLCRKVRVAHAEEELLTASSSQHVFAPDLQPQPMSQPTAQPMESMGMVAKMPRRMSVQRDLARLPCAMAEKALIGKAGLRMQRLRQTMQKRLCEELDQSRFRFWLDVREGRLVATVEAAATSFTEQRIENALRQLEHYVPEKVIYNKISYQLTEGRGLSRACEVMAEIPNHKGASVLIGRKGLRIKLLEKELRSCIGPEIMGCDLRLNVDSQQLTAVLEACDPSQTSAELKKALRKMRVRFLESHWRMALQGVRCSSRQFRGPHERARKAHRVKSVPSRAEKAREQTGLAKAKKLRTEQVVVAHRRRAQLKAVKAEKSRMQPKTSKSERMELKRQPKEILDFEW